MATMKAINLFNECGLPVTMEGPTGWIHSSEYNVFRINGKRGLVALLKRKFAEGDVRAGIQLALLNNTHNDVTEEDEQDVMES